ncbi:MAG: PD40 domain-containing protein [Burkholderiales bacterium]|nr:PD40 domain-containing protein [Phycisphaerae bacterium]
MMRTDGTHNLRITFTPGPDLLPAFSPDGKYLMWTTKRSSDKTSQIYIAKFKMPPAG